NAGMNQFKDVFLGSAKRDYSRAVTVQKCVRVGGKHNDFEQVGHTRRHLTFFEMLGNFSFGDYFKKEAIRFAWECTTGVFCLPPEKLWVSVHDSDEEAFALWEAYLPSNRIVKMGDADNFWAMGDVGPCGPCSELYFDCGEDFGVGTSPLDDPGGERYIEFWNLVFMQFERHPDGTQSALPKPSIDTGCGLERLTALSQGVKSVFETDLLRSLIAAIEEVAKRPYQGIHAPSSPAFHVIADHVRTLSFAIAEGVQPSNLDRGYVLRKLLRRAVRYGRTLGLEKPFLADLLPQLIAEMGDVYPEIAGAESQIRETLQREEEAFGRTLTRGGGLLSSICDEAKREGGKISGEEAFKLKDTYGFPLEEIRVIALDAGLVVDEKRYLELDTEARDRSRKVHKKSHQGTVDTSAFEEYVAERGVTQFTGYETLSGGANICGLIAGGEWVECVEEGEECALILDITPFYAEKGGQIGDRGVITAENGVGEFHVDDVLSPFTGVTVHRGKVVKGSLKRGEGVSVQVSAERRQALANNHTATHLLHLALQRSLGSNVRQMGSYVGPEALRFDFSHTTGLSTEQLTEIERWVNSWIRENSPVETREITYAEAQNDPNIKQFFGDKYGSRVRVVKIEGEDLCSEELCGGTHTSATGTIGLFRILSEASIASGVRRIVAVTGREAEKSAEEEHQLLIALGERLGTNSEHLLARVDQLQNELKRTHKELQAIRQGEIDQFIQQLTAHVQNLSGLPVVIRAFSVPPKELQPLALKISKQLGSGLVIVGTEAADEEKTLLSVAVSDDWVGRGIQAPKVIGEAIAKLGGRGGGKPGLAQGSASGTGSLNALLKSLPEILNILIKNAL
ncbi:MAG: alanine--tRNA ligase, partial [Chlamydiia bacterium]|nr:alanine--tRNA ligase [Chlamydiia bacterium]